MSDQVALRAAISANPDEDTPRLVFADWLDERGGKAGAKRAAYIRGEVADYHAGRADTATNAFAAAVVDAVAADYDSRTDWAAVDPDLSAWLVARKAAGKRWVKLTPKSEGVPRVKGVDYISPEPGFPRRGFYRRVWVDDTNAFLKHADAIFRAAPVSELVFEALNAEQAADFVRSGHVARVRELELRSPADPEALRVLGASRDALGIRDLDLTLSANGPALIGALAAGRNWTGLERLFATDPRTDVGPDIGESMTDLFTANPFPNLRELCVWGTGVNDDGAKLIARNFPQLRLADLAINEITGAGAAALAASKSLKHLRHLDLESCEMDEDTTAGTALIVTNNLPNLTVLKLYGLFRPSARVPVKGVRAPTLRSLSLGYAVSTPASLEALAKCPATRGLWRLKMDRANIGDEHLERFVKHAAFDRLVVLDLNSNQITGRGAKALAAWPGAAHLQWLDLCSNLIGESGAKALAASPHFAGLKTIRFNGRGTSTIKKRFKKAFE